MNKHFIIRSGLVPVDSILPKFNDVFPSLVAPHKRNFIDTFSGAAGALSGRPLEVAPEGQGQNWSANAGMALTGAGSLKPTSTAAGDLRALITTDGAGASGEWGATFLAGTVGSFGLMVRASEATQEAYRVVFRQTGEISLQRIAAGGNILSTPASAAFAYQAGQVYTLRVTVSGVTIKAFVDDAQLLTSDAISLETNPRAGVYFYASDAECLEFVGGS